MAPMLHKGRCAGCRVYCPGGSYDVAHRLQSGRRAGVSLWVMVRQGATFAKWLLGATSPGSQWRWLSDRLSRRASSLRRGCAGALAPLVRLCRVVALVACGAVDSWLGRLHCGLGQGAWTLDDIRGFDMRARLGRRGGLVQVSWTRNHIRGCCRSSGS